MGPRRHGASLALAAVILALPGAMLAASCASEYSTPLNPYPVPATPAAGAVVTVIIPEGAMGMGSQAYGSNPLVVPVGTTVIWVNKDTISHTSTSDTGVWDSGQLVPGQSFSYTFASPGTYPYHCSIHGAASMSGVVQVNPPPPPGL
jgi:plastocyanin